MTLSCCVPAAAASDWGLLGAAATLVSAAALYLRHRAAIHPDRVYAAALLRLNACPAVLEVMGAPVVGSDLRAYVITGE